MALPECKAWVFEVSDQQHIAVGEQSVLEYIGDASTFCVPATPRGCSRLLRWRGNVVPVFNFSAWLGEAELNCENQKIVVLHLQNNPEYETVVGGSGLIAIQLLSAPERIAVSDDLFLKSNQSTPHAWRPYLRSVFGLKERVIAILNLNKLLAAYSKPEDQQRRLKSV